MARKRYTQAITEALFEEMERDPKVIVFGEDVELAIFGDTRGLLERFGRDRIRNTPICEATLAGMAVGAAAAGYRVVRPHDVLELPVHGVRCHRESDGEAATDDGRAARAADHDHVGLRRWPLERGSALRHAALAADESRRRERRRAGDAGRCEGPAEDRRFAAAIRRSSWKRAAAAATAAKCRMASVLVPLGKANIAKEGKDVTLVAIGTMLKPALAAAKKLEADGISAEVVDPRTLVPLDEDTLLASVRKTGRVVVDR